MILLLALLTARGTAIPIQVNLTASDIEGKREVRLWNGTESGPLCDDRFTDAEAEYFCRLDGFDRGRRTSKTTEEQFMGTNLLCPNLPGFEDDWYDEMYLSECRYDRYGEDNVLPCSRNQAAAVYCWNLNRRFFSFIIQRYLKVTEKRWTIVLEIEDVKHGRSYSRLDNLLGHDGWPEVTHCTLKPFYKVKLKHRSKHKVFKIDGTFKKTCFECIRIKYLNEEILHKKICPCNGCQKNETYTSYVRYETMNGMGGLISLDRQTKISS